MARPRAYDPDDVIDKAMVAFWRNGYEATSLVDVEAATGLNRSSLYTAFGDMHALYLTALERFRDRDTASVLNALRGAPTVKEGLRRVFQLSIEALVNDPERRGCMIVNATAECVPSDPRVTAFVQAVDKETERAFAEAIRKAQAQGELSQAHDPYKLSAYLYSALQGLRLRGKAEPDRATLEGIVEVTLSVL